MIGGYNSSARSQQAIARQIRSGCYDIIPTDRSITHVLDIGAHIGSFSLYSRCRWRFAAIWAFEPEPENFEILRHNVERLRVRCVHAAYGDGSGCICQNPKHWKESMVARYRNVDMATVPPAAVAPAEPPVLVPSMQLQTLVAQLGKVADTSRILLKMDIEGAEAYLMHDTTFDATLKHIDVFGLEVHRPLWDTLVPWLHDKLQGTHLISADRGTRIAGVFRAVRRTAPPHFHYAPTGI
jgi:FkbM family methyltransferase